MHNLDEYDKKLLKHLQQNNKTSAQELGKMFNLSTSAVQRRLKKLRDEKIIEADVSVVSPSASGYNITCIVDVTLHLGNSKVIEAFKKLMNKCNEVSQCYYVTGVYDFIVVVHTKDMEDYEAFSKKYFMDNTEVKQFCTHVVMHKLKSGYKIKI